MRGQPGARRCPASASPGRGRAAGSGPPRRSSLSYFTSRTSGSSGLQVPVGDVDDVEARDADDAPSCRRGRVQCVRSRCRAAATVRAGSSRPSQSARGTRSRTIAAAHSDREADPRRPEEAALRVGDRPVEQRAGDEGDGPDEHGVGHEERVRTLVQVVSPGRCFEDGGRGGGHGTPVVLGWALAPILPHGPQTLGGRAAVHATGRPPGARTLNQRIKSPLLYQLS